MDDDLTRRIMGMVFKKTTEHIDQHGNEIKVTWLDPYEAWGDNVVKREGNIVHVDFRGN